MVADVDGTEVQRTEALSSKPSASARGLSDAVVPANVTAQVAGPGEDVGGRARGAVLGRLNGVRAYRRARYALFKLRTVHLSSGLLFAVASRLSPRVSRWMSRSEGYAKWYSRFVSRRINSTRFFNTINIETTNICNAKCVFCPYPIMKREKYNMSDDEFLGIIEKIRDHRYKPKTIGFAFFGEPFVDKKLTERIRQARRVLGNSVALSVTTNASLIRSELVEAILTSGIDLINVSFNGLDKADYENSMKLKFEITDNNVKRLLAERRRLALLRPYITVGCVMHSANANMDVTEFLRKWKALGADTVTVYPVNAHHETIKVRAHPRVVKRDTRYYPCRSLWMDAVIASSGDITICCLDYDADYKLGNVFKEDWGALFENSQRRAYQDMHTTNRGGDIPICSNCDSPKSSTAWLV
jgi:radical SAM protein with 4Fe4S-binding SPASM domain